MFFKILVTLVKAFVKVFFRVRIIGQENIPAEGGCIVCANHASNWDPVFLVVLLTRRVYFMAKAELFKVPLLGWLIKTVGMIPVKRAAADISAVRTSINALKDGKALGIFPSGRRVKKGEDAAAKSGVAFIAVKAAVPVVPIYIETTYKPFSKLTIHIGEAQDFAVYNKARLSSEQLGEISSDLFKNIYALAGDKK